MLSFYESNISTLSEMISSKYKSKNIFMNEAPDQFETDLSNPLDYRLYNRNVKASRWFSFWHPCFFDFSGTSVLLSSKFDTFSLLGCGE